MKEEARWEGDDSMGVNKRIRALIDIDVSQGHVRRVSQRCFGDFLLEFFKYIGFERCDHNNGDFSRVLRQILLDFLVMGEREDRVAPSWWIPHVAE
eukprot:CAMPEP_0201518936 /NCGR_PEP_ID=MMETSP0161_2-20130828/9647_1 /ASSEMBLY_ACC=CAM_ASM_000251 /TAXON_ID=180227 /ORGANISM="Neoparamoeba aestuarina, Strain SoJaBio B1-5/56/2" /LENGTH=95 /DNA_ID=CAMNT_0047916851 /DNA_START=53 /DNA_END=337 /DNA_ORIENTATION=+